MSKKKPTNTNFSLSVTFRHNTLPSTPVLSTSLRNRHNDSCNVIGRTCCPCLLSLSPSVRLYLPLTCINLLLWRGGHVTPYDTSSSLTSSLIHDLHICFDLFIILLSWVSKTVIFCVGLFYFLSARPGRGKSLLCCSSWISTIYYSPVLPDFTWCFFVIQIQGLKIKSVLTD